MADEREIGPARALPSLDLLKGFESAARHLNFTRAADELFLTQSAISKQVQALEERLGVRLFMRQRRGLQLTQEGDRLFRAVQGALRQVQEVIDSLDPRHEARRVTVTSTMAFCSLWLIPRLGAFNRAWPDVDVRIAANDRVLNLDRERIDISVRYAPVHAPPPGGVWLFDEELTPVCAPRLLADARTPLRSTADLAGHVLLHLDDKDNPSPWLSWNSWMDAVGARRFKAAGSLRFNYFDQIVRAALAGQGVALGRIPLVQDLLQDGSLVAPLPAHAKTDRGYWLVRAGFAACRPDVERLCEWIVETVRADQAKAAPAARPGTRPARRNRETKP